MQGLSIALAIHSLDYTVQLLDRDLEIAPTRRREDYVHRSSIDIALRRSAETGSSVRCRLIAPYSKKDQKAGARCAPYNS